MHFVVGIGIAQTPVHAYWEIGRMWRWQELSPLMTAENLLQLSALVLDTQSVQRDKNALVVHRWSVYSPGRISLAMDRTSEDQWDGWLLIWKLRVQQRVKVFIWMLAHGSILTNFRRLRMRLASNSDCWRCQGEC